MSNEGLQNLDIKINSQSAAIESQMLIESISSPKSKPGRESLLWYLNEQPDLLEYAYEAQKVGRDIAWSSNRPIAGLIRGRIAQRENGIDPNNFDELYENFGSLDNLKRELEDAFTTLIDEKLIDESTSFRELIGVGMAICNENTDDAINEQCISKLGKVLILVRLVVENNMLLDDEAGENSVASELRSNVGHEIKTPMTTIGTSEYLLNNPNQTPERKLKHFRIIIDRLAELGYKLDQNQIYVDLLDGRDPDLPDYSIDGLLNFIQQSYGDTIKLFIPDDLREKLDSLPTAARYIISQIVDNTLISINTHNAPDAVNDISITTNHILGSTGITEQIFINGTGTSFPKDRTMIYPPFKKGTTHRNGSLGKGLFPTGMGLGVTINKMLAQRYGWKLALVDEDNGSGSGTVLRFPPNTLSNQ